MSDDKLKCAAEFVKIVNQIRNNTGTKLLSNEELLFITADEIAHSYTMNERKPIPEGDVHTS